MEFTRAAVRRSPESALVPAANVAFGQARFDLERRAYRFGWPGDRPNLDYSRLRQAETLRVGHPPTARLKEGEA